ncbi:hypothetical protein [Nitratireductor sp. XY-223]|uniref:hypothetical protein n=1 Tax=Nitratireductor sp. XY-223 TaxID=2561926 RepID=UPI0010AA181E|nr:hypothetical protein [Nitratireductor sp. XY-223]
MVADLSTGRVIGINRANRPEPPLKIIRPPQRPFHLCKFASFSYASLYFAQHLGIPGPALQIIVRSQIQGGLFDRFSLYAALKCRSKRRMPVLQSQNVDANVCRLPGRESTARRFQPYYGAQR